MANVIIFSFLPKQTNKKAIDILATFVSVTIIQYKMKDTILTIITSILYVLKDRTFELISLFFFWLSPIQWAVSAVLFVIGIDTILGRKSAKVTAQRKGLDTRLEVTSKKTRVGFSLKVFIYISLIILTFVFDRGLFNDLMLYFFNGFPVDFLFTKVLAIIFMLIELDSIDEKVYNIKGVRLKQLIKERVDKIKSTVASAKDFKDKIS